MQTPTETLDAARSGDEAAFRQLVAPHQRGLLAHCYRMAGSLSDAEDMVQEALLRAWRGLSGFEGRSSFQSWIYRIATHATLDALRSAKARALPVAAVLPGDPKKPPDAPPLELHWIEPFPDALLPDPVAAADTILSQRETISLAFVQALQKLPATQRAAVLLKDVIGLSAKEVGDVLETTPAAVNSLVQRGRDTLRDASPPTDDVEATLRPVIDSFVCAWEQADVDGLIELLRDDARLSMPPSASWFEGPEAIGAFLKGYVFGAESAGRFRFAPTRANGTPATIMFDGDRPIGVMLFDVRGGRLFEMINFMDPQIIARFVDATATVTAS